MSSMADVRREHEEEEFERLWAPALKPRVFVDCGFHQGEGIGEFRTKLRIDDTWVLHAFELQCVPQLPEWLQAHPSFTLHPKAAWFEDGSLCFRQSSNTQCTTLVDSGHEFPERDDFCDFEQEWAEEEMIEAVDLWRFI